MSEGYEQASVILNHNESSEEESNEQHSDSDYDPFVLLPELDVPTFNEDEAVLINLRAKVYRYDASEDPPEWKERGTGTVKILHNKINDTVRIVMRRDRTLKLCANHFITPPMDLKPSISCERAWVYSVKADYIDDTAKSHLLAIKFASVENAQKWKEAFEKAKSIVIKRALLNKTVEDEKKILDDAMMLNDIFKDKENCSFIKEENCHLTVSEERSNNEVVEKFDSLSIKESEGQESKRQESEGQESKRQESERQESEGQESKRQESERQESEGQERKEQESEGEEREGQEKEG